MDKIRHFCKSPESAAWFSLICTAIFIIFGVYFRSSEIPTIQNKINEHDKQISALNATQPLILESLRRIETKVDRYARK